MAPIALVDWKADSGNQVTLPLGLGVGNYEGKEDVVKGTWPAQRWW
jgi:hypothetical protein